MDSLHATPLEFGVGDISVSEINSVSVIVDFHSKHYIFIFSFVVACHNNTYKSIRAFILNC